MNKPYVNNQVAVGLTDDEFATLCSEATRAGITRSEYIRRALRLSEPVRPRYGLGIVAHVDGQPYGCVYREN